MGCKNSRDCHEDVNPFDMKGHRSLSRMNNTPRARSSSQSSKRQSPGAESTSRDGSANQDVVERRYPVEDVPLVLSRFESLPSGAIKRSVFTVYDGDTITLRGKDNAKVRLLAMDTPEVQDHEPYALEARDFVAKLILKKDVFLVFEGQEKDRYGRYLAYVYIKDKSVPPFRFINVNIAVIEVGLANYYHPQPTPLTIDSVFLQAQGAARSKKLHLWKDVCEDYVVYRTAHGRAFHRKNCRSIEHVPLSSMIMKEALDEGYYACRDCHPNWASKGKHITDHLPKAAPENAHKDGSIVAAVARKPAAATEDVITAKNDDEPKVPSAAADDHAPVAASSENSERAIVAQGPTVSSEVSESAAHEPLVTNETVVTEQLCGDAKETVSTTDKTESQDLV
jgi:micrococcal nuclease